MAQSRVEIRRQHGWGWGSNLHGEIKAPAGNDFMAITAGYDFSVALSKYAAWISRVVSKTGKPGKPATISGRGFSTTNLPNKVYFSTGILPHFLIYLASVKSSAKDKLLINIPKKCQSGKTYFVRVLVNGQTSNTLTFKVK